MQRMSLSNLVDSSPRMSVDSPWMLNQSTQGSQRELEPQDDQSDHGGGGSDERPVKRKRHRTKASCVPCQRRHVSVSTEGNILLTHLGRAGKRAVIHRTDRKSVV